MTNYKTTIKTKQGKLFAEITDTFKNTIVALTDQAFDDLEGFVGMSRFWKSDTACLIILKDKDGETLAYGYAKQQGE